jgi:hypothetical protein
MHGVFPLVAQAVLAAVGLVVLFRRVFPHLGPDASPGVLADVWLPLVLIGPMLFFAGRVEVTVRGAGWLPLGAPVCLGVVTVGSALLVAPSTSETPSPRPLLVVSAVGAGLVLLLLGAAHDLTVWIGQLTFAVAAVLLWSNTPAHVSDPDRSTATTRAAPAVAIAAVIAVALGSAVLLTRGRAVVASGALVLGYAVVAAVGIVRVGGLRWSLRVGGWMATIGVLLGVGTLSLITLVPQAARLVVDEDAPVDGYVAHGFGTYAAEGVLLVLLPAGWLSLRWLDRTVRRCLGAVLVAVAAVLVAWRLTAW